MQVNRLPATSPMEIDEHLGRIPSLEPARTARRHRAAGQDALMHYGDAAAAWDRQAMMISLLPLPKQRAPLSKSGQRRAISRLENDSRA
jgi:hypothetical protein